MKDCQNALARAICRKGQYSWRCWSDERLFDPPLSTHNVFNFMFQKGCKIAREGGGKVIAVSKNNFAADYGIAKQARTESVGKIHQSRVPKAASSRGLSLSCIFVERSLSGLDAILRCPTVGRCTSLAT